MTYSMFEYFSIGLPWPNAAVKRPHRTSQTLFRTLGSSTLPGPGGTRRDPEGPGGTRRDPEARLPVFRVLQVV